MDSRILELNKHWSFSLTDNECFREYNFDHSSWEVINLPHDWMINQDYNKECDMRTGWFVGNVGWYRKTLYLTKEMLSGKVFLIFDGVYMNSTVYINGYELGNRPYGNINFEYELTGHLIEGINIIAIRVDTSKALSARWYTGSGLNRSVELRFTGRVYMPTWGMNITVKHISQDKADIHCEMEIENTLENPMDICLITRISYKDRTVTSKEENYYLAKGLQKIECQLTIEVPMLWELEDPNLYTCQVELVHNEEVSDRQEQIFGIRSVEFKPNKGFFLNNKNIKLKGVCLHNDCGVVGTAVPKNIWIKRIGMLKEMGCNAIRTAHHPFPKEFYEVCNNIGMMVMDEIFDGWECVKASYDYGLYFKEWYENDLTNFIKRDRNHPCVIMWSIGNEVHGMNVDTTKRLQELVHQLDGTRYATCGIQGIGKESDENRAILDIAGYNDGGGACFVYERDHKRRPNQLFVATEAPHSFHTRGFYRTQTWWRDKNQPRMEIENLTEEEIFFDGSLNYYSSYDNAGVRTCARDSWSLVEEYDYLCGEFRWTGFDYYGESFGWPSRFVANGVIDAANFVKDHYYLYQSMWINEPMVHCLPHWTHPQIQEGTIIPIWVYTNCEEAELFVSGKSLGKKVKGSSKHLSWDIPYKKGTLSVVAYNGGIPVARKDMKTAGIPKGFNINVDSGQLTEEHVRQISVEIVDEYGELVPYADNSICFIEEGDLQVIGTENGDSMDLTPIRSKKRKAYNGLVAAYVRGEEQKDCVGKVYVLGILGETVFEKSTLVSIDVQKAIWGEIDNEKLDLYYTLDTTEPTKTSCKYEQPLLINQTTYIKIAIYGGEQKIGEHSAFFFKGEKEKVVDLTHSNKVLNLEKPLGPFAKQIVGEWREGENKYYFESDGRFMRILENNIRQEVGNWWYDFPVDYFEAQEYAGTGEIWFISGEKQKFRLLTQEAKEIEIDNRKKGLSTAYGSQEVIVLKRN